jgi:hypothetical protein
MWEFYVFARPDVAVNMKLAFKEHPKDLTSNQKLFSFLMLLYTFWTMFGLLTFQWYMFVIFTIWSLIHIKDKTEFRFKVDSLGSIVILIFIILNKFHFKIHFLN